MKWIFVLLTLVVRINCNSYYTIVAPQHIRPNSDYQVSVTLHNDVQPVTMRLAITNAATYKNEKEVTITSNQTKLISFEIGDLLSSGYRFVAEGVKGLSFRNESSLDVVLKNVSIFIQTDKSVYKPGEIVKFRVLVLDFELKPAKLTSFNLLQIQLYDPVKNLIKQWLNVEPKKGVYASEFQLSELPVLGKWKIEVGIGREHKTKEIEVLEYVLPNFDVAIDSPTEIWVKDGIFRAIIRSKYTYGKLVKGKAIVALTPKSTSSRDGIVSKTITINGKGTAEFDISNELLIEFDENESSVEYELNATAVEELTGRNQSISKTIKFHKNRYKIDTIDFDRQFIRGQPLKFKIHVSLQDNSPVLLNEETKSIFVEKCSNSSYKFDLNDNGFADIEITTLESEHSFNLKVRYVDETKDLGYIYHLYIDKSTQKHLQAKVLTKRPTLNENVSIEVESIDVLQNFTYLVIGRTKIVYAENVAVPRLKRYEFNFKATFDLVPKASLIVYHFKDDKIVSTRTEISIDDDLNNFVKLKLSTTETQPGKDVDIDVITQPESYVGLVGVDQSVLLLHKNDGLTRNDAFDEMNSYYKHQYIPGIWTHSYYDREYLFPFDQSSVMLFSNAKRVVRRYKPVYHGHGSLSHRPVSGWSSSASAASSVNQTIKEPVDPPKIRSEFPETWLWEDFNVNNPNGTFTLTKKVPDTITSWVISAFALNANHGLGLTKNPRTLNVFQPFFVSFSLPYSMKRGEVVSVPIVLFNYLETNVTADLTLHNENEDFEFVDTDENDQELRTRQLTVASNDGVSVSFLIRFNSVGQIPLKVTATSAVAGDSVVRVIQVDPEGIPQYINKIVFIDLRETNAFEITQSIDVPKNSVPDSLKIYVNAVGDLLASVVQNLHSLIRLPTGCGEQNMMNFVPNIVVLDYLTSAGKLDVAVKDKAIKFLLSGYQRELTYRHSDGSFSVFGKSDSKGSTWLTAYVAKSFKQAENYIDIDGKVIAEALEFLSQNQAADGSFPEIGYVYDKHMQGGANNGVSLTAYTTIAFLQNKQLKDWKYQANVDRAIKNILENIQGIDNTYAQSIAAYALQLAEHPQKDEVLNALVNKTIQTEHHKWWSAALSNDRPSKSIDVEMTSYGLLSLVKANRLAEALPYFKWLLAQRNDKGGFFGTQDTVIGLEALAAYGRFVTSTYNHVHLKVQADGIEDRFLDVIDENALLLQTIEIPSEVESVILSASGHGFAIVQLSYRYNLNETYAYTTFSLEPKVLENTAGRLKVQVCSKFNAGMAEEHSSNMVIVEVALPSGFLIEKDQLNELLHKPHIKRVETKRGDTVADIYYDHMMAGEEMCIEIKGYRSHIVAENKPVPVRIYDYYDSSRSEINFYEMPLIDLCDICEGDECSKSCKN